ncbi:MAG: hypothetical protein ACC658_02190 [Acidimicrobiia bacterium]
MERLPDPQGLATKNDLKELGSELRAEMGGINHRLTGIEGKLEGIDGQFEKIDARFEKIDDRLYDFHESLRSYARTFVIAQTATVFGVSGIVLGITQLL